MNYTTIKIPAETHRLIKSLSAIASLSQQELLQVSLLDYQKKLFWEQCSKAYSQAVEMAVHDDTHLYENTLMDGLDEEY